MNLHIKPFITVPVLLTIIILAGCAGPKSMVKPTAKSSVETGTIMPPRASLEHYINALTYEDARYYQGALSEYKRALTFDPFSVELRLGVARNFFFLQMHDSAAVAVQGILDFNPGNREALELLGKIYSDRGEWDSAISVFEELTEIEPENPEYYARLAAAYIAQGEPDKGVEAYFAIAELDDNAGRVLERAAMVMTTSRHFEQAIKLYRKALEYNPTDETLYYSIGNVHLQADNVDSALYYTEIAYEANPDHPQYALALGYMYNQQGRREEAAEVLQHGIEANPGDTRLYNLLGSILQRLGRSEQALEVLQKSITIDSTSMAPLITMGFIYDDTNDLDKAVEIYEKAIALDSTSALVLNNYAYLLAVRGERLEEALAMSEKALILSPDNPSYLDTIGWIYFQMGDYEKAEQYLRRAMELGEDSVIYLHLGDILDKSGRPMEALEIYQQGLDKYPDDEDLKQRLEEAE